MSTLLQERPLCTRKDWQEIVHLFWSTNVMYHIANSLDGDRGAPAEYQLLVLIVEAETHKDLLLRLLGWLRNQSR
jgi:hypothetical protein